MKIVITLDIKSGSYSERLIAREGLENIGKQLTKFGLHPKPEQTFQIYDFEEMYLGEALIIDD